MKILKFYAEWCNPCKRLSKYLNEHPPALEIEEINVEDNPMLASQFDVMSVPVIVVQDDDGNEVARNTSSDPVKVQQFLESHNLL